MLSLSAALTPNSIDPSPNQDQHFLYSRKWQLDFYSPINLFLWWQGDLSLDQVNLVLNTIIVVYITNGFFFASCTDSLYYCCYNYSLKVKHVFHHDFDPKLHSAVHSWIKYKNQTNVLVRCIWFSSIWGEEEIEKSIKMFKLVSVL